MGKGRRNCENAKCKMQNAKCKNLCHFGRDSLQKCIEGTVSSDVDGSHAACNSQCGHDGRQNADDELQDEFPSILCHSGYRL